MRKTKKIMLLTFLFTLILLLPYEIGWASTSRSITSHPKIEVNYSISGGNITDEDERGNPNWGKRYTGTVKPGDTITVNVEGSTNNVFSDAVAASPRDSNFFFHGWYTINNVSKNFSQKNENFPYVGSNSHSGSITVTDDMDSVHFRSRVGIVWRASGQTFGESVWLSINFEVEKEPPPPEPEPELEPTIRITNCPGQLIIGASGRMTAAVNPPKDPNGKDWRISWFVDNERVLTIDDEGNYVAQRPGQVTIVAYLHDNQKVLSTCSVVVDKPKDPDPPPPPDSPDPSIYDTNDRRYQSPYSPYDDDHVPIDPESGRTISEIISQEQAEIQRVREALSNIYGFDVGEDGAREWLIRVRQMEYAAQYRDEEFNKQVVETINDIRDLADDPTKKIQDTLEKLWAIYTGNWRWKSGPELVADFLKDILPRGKFIDKALKWIIGEDYPDQVWDLMSDGDGPYHRRQEFLSNIPKDAHIRYESAYDGTLEVWIYNPEIKRWYLWQRYTTDDPMLGL